VGYDSFEFLFYKDKNPAWSLYSWKMNGVTAQKPPTTGSSREIKVARI